MAGIEQDLAAHVPTHQFMEALEGRPVVQVFAGMDLVAEVHALLVAEVEDRPPAPRQFIERSLDQPGRALREGEQVGPGERAGKRPHVRQPQAPRRLRRQRQPLQRRAVRAAGLPCTACGAKLSHIAS